MFPHGKSIIVSQFFSRKYDGFCWIGGTCMTDSAGDGACGYMNSFNHRGKRIGYVGIGINEIHNQVRKKAYKDILDKANLVTLRDEKSYSIAKELSSNQNILLTEDLVYLSDEVVRLSPEDRVPKLLVAWRSLRGYCSEEVENRALDTLAALIVAKDEYEEIIISPLGNQVDDEPNRKLYSKLSAQVRNVRFTELQSYKQKIDLICSATTVITGRLHAIFIAEWNNINTVAIGYDTKVKSFLESIKRTEDLVFPETLTPEIMEQALLAKHKELTAFDWKERQDKSMKNVLLFEEMI